MPPKSKDLKPKSKVKSKTPNPQSENEFLEAADEFEQAGGKWRAGDAAKAARFFTRAIQAYDDGLKRFPNSFDLAYNKAHLQYEICEDERLVGSNKLQLLQETLRSHRVALALNQDNLDVRFNAGQVLTSLVEAALEDENEALVKEEAMLLLEEAVDLFTNCLVLQQRQYEQMVTEIASLESGQGDLARHEEDMTADAQQNADTASTTSSTPGEWVTVEEALTPEVILETCKAQLNTLATLLDLSKGAGLARLESPVKDGLYTVNTSIPTLISLISTTQPPTQADEPIGPTLSLSAPTSDDTPSSPTYDALIAAAVFQATLADASYRSGEIPAAHYATTVSTLFSSFPPALSDHTAKLFAHVDALIAIADAVSNSPSDVETRWTALSQVQNLLTKLWARASATALVMPMAPSAIANMFSMRGDAELVRFNLSFTDNAPPAWAASRKVLISNAGVFYRAAKGYGEKAGDAGRVRSAGGRAVVAEVLKEVLEKGAGVEGREAWREKRAEVREVLEVLGEENILGAREAGEVMRIVG